MDALSAPAASAFATLALYVLGLVAQLTYGNEGQPPAVLVHAVDDEFRTQSESCRMDSSSCAWFWLIVAIFSDAAMPLAMPTTPMLRTATATTVSMSVNPR